MFGVMKRREGEASIGDIETIIGRNTRFRGEISGTGNLRVDGEVEGELNLSGAVIIGEAGMVTGDVTARSLNISGTVHGNARTEEGLTIHSTGQLIGDVKVNAFLIEDGGIFKGRSEMNPRSDVVLKDRPRKAPEPVSLSNLERNTETKAAKPVSKTTAARPGKH